jgi:hypothetical protein
MLSMVSFARCHLSKPVEARMETPCTAGQAQTKYCKYTGKEPRVPANGIQNFWRTALDDHTNDAEIPIYSE